MSIKYNINDEAINTRLDVFVSSKLNMTRSQLKNHITDILVNGVSKKFSYMLKKDDSISVNIEKKNEENNDNPEPQDIPIDIIYQDNDILVLNKASGLSVHCSPSEMNGTLVNALLYHIKDFRFYGEKTRAGIIHRLDKDTSGLIIIGKSPDIVTSIQDQFKERSVEKTYHAIVVGNVRSKNFTINLPIGRHNVYRKKMTVRSDGKESITNVNVIKRFDAHTLVEASPKTGRTHQIRVHLSYKGYPIAGDKIYSKSSCKYETLMLHAKKLSFKHPKTNETLEFEADYPTHFYNLLYSENI